MKRLTRWLVYAVALLLVLGAAALVGLRLYLGSASGLHLLVEQLSAKFGSKVEVDHFEPSTFGTSRVRGLHIHDGNTGKTFLDADEVDVDLSIFNLLTGRRSPHRLTVNRPRVVLRFDPSGKLLTQMPNAAGGGPMPQLNLSDGRLTLAQAGRPPLVLDKLNLEISSAQQDNLSGTLDDPTFGHFDITGNAGDAFTVALKGKVPRVTPAMLRGLPFVPPAVWKQVEAEGIDVPLDLGFTFQKVAPEVQYRVGFANARVRLLQSDRPSMEVYPAHGTMKGNEGDFLLEGEVKDPYWGDWAVRVTDRDADKATKINLTTASVKVTQKKLVALPYVPKHVWDEVTAEGQTAAEVNVNIPAGPAAVHYRVDLDVPKAAVGIPAIALKVPEAKGKVRVEDELVTLEGVTGKLAGGTIGTSGDLDFRKDPSTMRFVVAVKAVNLRGLPEKWGLSRKPIEGKVSGKADVVLTLGPRGVETRGSGSGQIDDAKVAGFKTAHPIKLTLHAEGNRLHFRWPALEPAKFLPLPILLVAQEAPRRVRPDTAADAAGRILDGAEAVGRGAAEAARQALRLLDRAERPFRSKQTEYLDARVDLDNVDLTELARRLDLALPFELTGQVSVKMVLGVPVNNAHDLRDYRLTGTASSARLAVAGLQLRDTRSRIDYARGVLRLTDLAARVRVGKQVGAVSGSATVGVVPRRGLAFDVKADGLPADLVARFVPGVAGRLAGPISGPISARVPIDRLDEPAAWSGTARLSSPDLRVYGVDVRNVTAAAEMVNGKGAVRELRGELYRGKLTGSAGFDLAGEGSYEAGFALRGADLSEAGAKLPAGFRLTGSGDLAGTLRGTTGPLTWAGGGTVKTHGVRVGKLHVEDLMADWSLDGDLLRLSKITGTLYKGAIAGAVDVRLARTAGNVKVRLQDLDAAALGKAIEGVPLNMAGKVSGVATVSFAPMGGRTRVTSNVDLRAAKLSVQGIPASRVRGKLDYNGETLDYRLDGDTLGGKVILDGTYPPPPAAPHGRSDGRLRIERLLIERLVEARRLGEAWRPLTGMISLTLPFRFDGAEKILDGRGRVEVSELRYNDTELTDFVRGELLVHNGRITVRELTGTVAGGLLRVAASYYITGPARGWFDVNLTGAEARRILVVVGLKDKVRGAIDVRLRGEINDPWRGNGVVRLHRGRVAGIALSDARVPVSFTYDPQTAQLAVTISDSSAHVGQGRTQLRADLRVGDSVSAEGHLLLLDAALGALAALTGDLSSYVRGRVTGQVDFGGSGMRSLGDLTVLVRAKLRDAQALQLPILRQLIPYLPAHSWREFTRGSLHAQLRGGIFRVDELTLESTVLQLAILGVITTAGRLDLDVTAYTTPLGGVPVVAQRLTRGLPAVGPVPLGILVAATRVLSTQLLHFHISGTVHEPKVTIQPLRTLSEGALRLFVAPGSGGR